MKIKLTKDFRVVNYDRCRYSKKVYSTGEVTSFDDEDAQWLIDNGFAEEVKESDWWKPKKGDTYYVTNYDGCITTNTWDGCAIDLARYKRGECFKTERAADRWSGYLKAVATVRQDDGVLTPEQIHDECQDSCIYYVGVRQNGQLAVDCILVERDTIIASSIYFDTYKQAEASLDEHLNEWRIISNYDWSRE